MDGIRPQRAADGDIMRLIACFFVIMIHVSTADTSENLYSSGFLVPCLLNAISRFSVPVFVMLSGRFMLQKPPDTAACLKRALRLFCVLLLWGTAYWLYDRLTVGFEGETLGGALRTILTQPVHLWYFYAAIALYLFTPLLAVFARKAEKRVYQYALVLTFVFGSLVTIYLQTSNAALAAEIVDKMKVDCTLGFVWCYLFGYYVNRFGFSGRYTRPVIYLLGALGAAATFGVTALWTRSAGEGRYLLFSFFSPTVLASSAAFFLGLGQIFGKMKLTPKAEKLLREAAGCTAGIYGGHMLIFKLLPWQRLTEAAGHGVRIIVTVISVFLLTGAAIWLLRKIPGVRKII